MSLSLNDGRIWFVRKDNGNGMVPVTREGWMVALGFVAGAIAASIVCVTMIVMFPDMVWLGFAAFVVIMIADGIAFIVIANAMGDRTVTRSEWRRRQEQP
jgi:cell division GTPase FtsZ